MDLTELVRSLFREASARNERRLVVLSGGREAGHSVVGELLDAVDADPRTVTVVTDSDVDASFDNATSPGERITPSRADDLLGETRSVVVLDAHSGFSPNVLGRVVGAVDGGGILVLLTPSLSDWPERPTEFDEAMAVPPFGVEDVSGRFRERLVGTLRTHPGVAIVDLDHGRIERDGLIGGSGATIGPRQSNRSASRPDASIPTPTDTPIPEAAFAACRTADQARAVRTLAAVREPGNAVVLEADRGRGKSSAAGLAAGALAHGGADVLVTAPSFRATRECFRRAEALLSTLETDSSPEGERGGRTPTRQLSTAAGGHVRFVDVDEAVDLPDDPDVVVVDEAAALPVGRLEQFLAAPSVAFCTTVHGYEGAGRSFSVRFRDRLDDSRFRVRDVDLAEPIRYAADDPIETWAFRALLLDARPAVAPAVEDATLDSVEYRAPTSEELLADEHLLGEAFGLLVLAHYRTEPDDLARLLDAPNLRLRVLTHEGHVVSVALVAREGGLGTDIRASMYEGARVRGNMLPDVLTSQLRDEGAAAPVGYRIVRIATHHAVRRSGFGSRLLAAIEAEVSGGSGDPLAPSVGPDRRLDAVDWLGVGYGATPELLRFWAGNGYRTVHFSTTRNDTSGEYSALMLRPLTEDGVALCERHGRRFRDRVVGLLSDPIRDADPDVVRATLRTVPANPQVDLSTYEQRVAVGAAYGPGLSDVAPGVFRELALAAFLSSPLAGDGTAEWVDGEPLVTDDGSLVSDDEPLATVDDRERRLLVRKCLQGHSWTAAAEQLGYVSASECRRTFGRTMQPLVDSFCELAEEERLRYVE